MNNKSKKNKFIILLITLCMVLIVYTGIDYFKTRTIKGAIEHAYKNAHPTFKLKKILNVIDVNGNDIFIFYVNHANSISDGHLSKKWNGGWKVISLGGTLALEMNNTDTFPFRRSFDNETFIYGGILYNKDTDKIYINGAEATIMDNDEGIRIYYKKTDQAEHAIETEGYDSSEQLIWTHNYTYH